MSRPGAGRTLAALTLGLAESAHSSPPPLIAPEEHRWFDKLSDPVKDDVRKRARAARQCPARYRGLYGSEAARRVSKSRLPPLLTAVSDGVVVYGYVPGLDACNAPLGDRDSRFAPQPDAYTGPAAMLKIERACASEAFRYAIDYNRELIRLRPELANACLADGPLRKSD